MSTKHKPPFFLLPGALTVLLCGCQSRQAEKGSVAPSGAA